MLTHLSVVFSIPLSIWAEHNGTAFHFVSTCMCGRLNFNVPHSGPLVVWATKAFHGTTAQSVVRFTTQDAKVTFKQALTCRKISVILNGGLRQEGHTTQVRDTTSSGTREASSTKGRRRPAVGESRHSWSQKLHSQADSTFRPPREPNHPLIEL